MQGKEGHVCLGLVFLIIGIWHLFNHVKNNATLRCYKSLTWFPTSFSKYLELYLILLGTSYFIISELHSSPLDHDGAILANHLHKIEHVSIAMAFFFHALFSIFLEKTRPMIKAHIDMGHFVMAMAFVQELLLIHYHSTNHMGLEDQYHLLFQQVVVVCLFTSLLSTWLPKSFMVCYIRSIGVILQGIWLITMGFMLWTPEFAPKGCLMTRDDYNRNVIDCKDHGSLHRGKALVNILFSWILIGVVAFGAGIYLFVSKHYGAKELTMHDEGEEFSYQMDDKQRFIYRNPVVSVDLEE